MIFFLSHSSLDQELTCAVYDLFTQNGFKVYLDYEDNELNPDNVTFDGISNGMCCILPIVKESGKSRFNGQEYLGMYPYLTYTEYADSDEWTFWIEDPENPKKYTTLKAWLTGKKLKIHD